MEKLGISNRIRWIDSLKGFGMICVVLGHLSLGFYVEKYIYSFHMVLFFFISGMLYSSKNDENIFVLIKKKAVSLLIPFLIWDMASFLVDVFLFHENLVDAIIKFLFLHGKESWDAPIWFLLALFWTEILYNMLKRVNIPDWFILMVSLGLMPIMNKKDIYPFMINVIPISIMFYIFGLSFKKFIQNDVEKSLKNKIMFGFAIVFILAAGLNDRISFTGAYFGNYLLFMIAGISGVVFISVLFEIYIKKNSLLEAIGKKNMFIMCIQYWIFTIIDIFSQHYFKISLWHYDSFLKAAILTVVTFAICFSMIKLNKKVIKLFKINNCHCSN